MPGEIGTAPDQLHSSIRRELGTLLNANEEELMMRKLAILATGVSLLAGISPGQASDHLFTAVGAGGLTTTSSNPFVKTNGRPADIVPGQGSPLSGADHTTPAVEMGSLLTHHLTEPNTNANPGNGTLKTPPPVTAGKTAPSANSPHMAFFVP